jgi:acetylornithine/succinyldiaminopimelate/putrescine aminotransferase
MDGFPDVLDTCRRMIDERQPNFLRLYLNPAVGGACLLLNRLVSRTFPCVLFREPDPVFLATSGEEALSGALKLARFTVCNSAESSAGESRVREQVLLLDPQSRFPDFAALPFVSGAALPLIPEVRVWNGNGDPEELSRTWAGGIVVLAFDNIRSVAPGIARAVQQLIRRPGLLVIIAVTRESLPHWELISRQDVAAGDWSSLCPDIVVFDDSFTGGTVPFGAFVARQDIYRPWMRGKRSTFHSTTFQPNTLSCRQFLACCRVADPEWFDRQRPDLKRLEASVEALHQVYRTLFSPSLSRLIRKVRFDRDRMTASGHEFRVGRKGYFDGVAGVACSLRGHNPPTLVEEVLASRRSGVDARADVSRRLTQATGLTHVIPATSGATAVETALRLALAAQYPRTHVLVLSGGYAGKTLLALTGTTRAWYREQVGPLYPHVVICDPFAPDAIERLRAVLESVPVAVVQTELIQGVGGVRELPPDVVNFLHQQREHYGYLLFVDEIQTGMFRTGPLLMSESCRLMPDLVTIGKATSDMVFPMSLTLCSEAVVRSAGENAPQSTTRLLQRAGCESGWHVLRNALERAEQQNLPEQVRSAGEQLLVSLRRELAGCRMVRDIRGRGLLIGIELNRRSLAFRMLGPAVSRLYLLELLKHRERPLLMGFCQFEPHVFKLTPPLSITGDEIRDVSCTLRDVLHRSVLKVAASGLKALAVR